MPSIAVIPQSEQREVETQLRELLAFLADVQITETSGVRGLSAIVADVTALGPINCVHTLERAEALIVELRKYEDAVKAKLDTPTDYAFRVHKWFTGIRARFAGQAEAEARKLAQACGAYRKALADEAERRAAAARRKAQEDADAENVRRRKEFDEQVAAEKKRIADERANDALAAAARLEAEGRKDEADTLLSNAADLTDIEPSLPEPELAVPAPVAVAEPVAKAQGVGYRKKWTFRVTDAAKIERQYLLPKDAPNAGDDALFPAQRARVQAIVTAFGKDAPVKGIEVYEDQVASVKRR